jgi:hypothetical protein
MAPDTQSIDFNANFLTLGLAHLLPLDDSIESFESSGTEILTAAIRRVDLDDGDKEDDDEDDEEEDDEDDNEEGEYEDDEDEDDEEYEDDEDEDEDDDLDDEDKEEDDEELNLI